MLCSVADEIIAEAEAAVQRHKEDLKARSMAGDTITSAMRQKAVLMSYRNVTSLNAETTAYRHTSLRVLHQHLKRVREPLKWAIPAEHLKPTMNWSIEWTPFEDARMMVGIWRHGFASWETIMNVGSRSFRI